MSILICAHRGASAYAPENTLEAFQLAVDQGADAVELDVHLTRDGKLLVAHDEKIDRVSDGTGFIAQMTLAQIKKHVFNKPHPAYEGALAPTLEEVFELLKPTGLIINVELKNNVNPYPGLEEKALALAAKMGMEDRVLYSSFNHLSMVLVKQLNPQARCALLYGSVLIEPWQYASAARMDALHPPYQHILHLKDYCQQAKAKGLQVNVWTVNNDRDMLRVIHSGCDMMITDYPDRARALMG